MANTRFPLSSAHANLVLACKLIEAEEAEAEYVPEESPYRYDVPAYTRDNLHWTPWASGDANEPGQVEIMEKYAALIRAQEEKMEYDSGLLAKSQLEHYNPDEPLKYIIQIPKGYNTGGTKTASAIVSHFVDNFAESICLTFAPTWNQISGLLWKEIINDRKAGGRPGKLLEGNLEIKMGPKHFAQGRATSDASGKGMERIQGQHAAYLMFVVDEAEGVAEYVFDAIDKMGSSIGAGVVIVIALANPRTRTSRFHRLKDNQQCEVMRLSCLYHPNVLQGRAIVPGSVSRDWVNSKIKTHCREVPKHNPDFYTFEVPWMPGLIFQPDTEFQYSVMGIAPVEGAADTVIPAGRYERAYNLLRFGGNDTPVSAVKDSPHVFYDYISERLELDTPFEDARLDCWIGCDVARFGTDFGTIYVRWCGMVWRAARLSGSEESDYYREMREVILEMHRLGARRIRVRIDTTGGYGGGAANMLEDDLELGRVFLQKPDVPRPGDRRPRVQPMLAISQVSFGATPTDRLRYADVITELYHEAGETLKGVALVSPPRELDMDLTDRRYGFKNFKGRSVRKLEEKGDTGYGKRNKRSPDDGDGAVMAMAPDHVIRNHSARVRKPRTVVRA